MISHQSREEVGCCTPSECGQNKYNLCLRFFGTCPLRKPRSPVCSWLVSPRLVGLCAQPVQRRQRQAAAACSPFPSGKV